MPSSRRPTARLSLGAIILTVATVGCGDDEGDGGGPGAGGGGTTCGPDEILSDDGSCESVGPAPSACSPGQLELGDGSCQPAGLPADMECAPGERAAGDSCIPAGIAADGCGDGFAHDGVDGCDPILPASACPAGQMALPGETSCREVADCGAAPYGSIPTDGTTQHVDAAYGGGNSDGTSERPWTTLTDGYDAAGSGAIVAVAAGVYPGGLVIANKPVRLWGRCPNMVVIDGDAGAGSSVFVWSGASGTEIRGLSITGAGYGLVISDAEQVLLEQLRVHDNQGMGLQSHTGTGPASVTVRGSLFEANVAQGLFAWATSLIVEDSVVRDTTQVAGGATSSGLAGNCNDAGHLATVSVSHSLIERNITGGIVASCVDLTVTDTVIRDQVVDPNGQGVAVDVHSGAGAAPSTLAIRTSALLDGNNIAVALRGVTATIDDTVIRGTGPRPGGGGGHGINIRDDEISGDRSDVTVRTSLLEDNNHIGFFVYGSDGLLQDSVVRHTLPDDAGYGVAVQLEKRPEDGERPSVRVERSSIEDCSDLGMYVTGGDLTLEASVLRDTVMGNEFFGGGLYAGASADDSGRTSLAVHRSLISGNADNGVLAWGADVHIAESVVADTQPSDIGRHGSGVMVRRSTSSGAPATLTMLGTLLERNHTFGVMSSAREGSLDGLVVRDTRVAPAGHIGCGVAFMHEGEPGAPIVGQVTNTLVEQSRDVGIYSFGAEVRVEGVTVIDTESDAEGLYGDGICVDSSADYPSQATINDTTVQQSARAGILSFGSHVAIGRSLLLCQAFEMDGENWDTPFQFDDLGGNGCGCPAPAAACQVVTATLVPPAAPPLDGEPEPTHLGR